MTLTVVRSGMQTTVQDLGRRGYQNLGVPVSGPMDIYSHRLANHVLGNDAMAAALEITLTGPELLADGEVICAVAGAQIDVDVDGTRVAPNRPFAVRPGERIRFGTRHRGARATLAVRGGFDCAVTLGSRATHIASHMGPFGGRALKTGDVLRVTGSTGFTGSSGSAGSAGSGSPTPLELPDGGTRLRVLPGVHRERFTDEAWAALVGARFTVTPQSNRMGYRLAGAELAHVGAADILSEAMPPGAIQVPASRQPILLLAERATTGGYATIATVITADLPRAGQLAPGDWIEFAACTREEALAALRAQEAALMGVR